MIEQLKIAAQWMEQAGAIIAVVLDPATKYWLEDGSAAVQNMLVAATALGYGSCWLEGYTLPLEGQFKALLGRAGRQAAAHPGARRRPGRVADEGKETVGASVALGEILKE